MKKSGVIYHYITLAVICQGVLGILGGVLGAWGGIGGATPVFAEGTSEGSGASGESGAKVSEEKAMKVKANCEKIKESLGAIQRKDARTRVYLGRYYETILADFVTPLNVRLVENNLSNADLIENQNGLALARSGFNEDYISYQQGLEELTMMDCRTEPEKFYEKLVKVREQRGRVEKDVKKMRGLITEQVELVRELKAGLK